MGMEVSNSHFSAFIDLLTSSTYIMLVSVNGRVPVSMTKVNIGAARKLFAELMSETP